MSQLDQIVASVEDSILPGIKYSLNKRKGASFVHQTVLSPLSSRPPVASTRPQRGGQ